MLQGPAGVLVDELGLAEVGERGRDLALGGVESLDLFLRKSDLGHQVSLQVSLHVSM